MMDNPGDDDAGGHEWSQINNPTNEAIGPRDCYPRSMCHYPNRDWCRACVGSTGRSDAHKRRHEERNRLPVASMDYGFFTAGDDGEHTTGVTPFLVLKVKPSMMIWSMPVQCRGVEDWAAIKDTVETSNRLGYLELIVTSDNEPAMLAFRDAVIREPKERFGVRAIAQAPHKVRFCVSGHGGKRHQIGQGESTNAGDCDT